YENHSLTPPQHALTNSTWDQCHQSDPDKLFLLWHRVYVYYFEQIARKVSGNASFSLPYWDYGTELNSRRIPVEFRSPKYKDPKTKKDIENPLYEQRRSSVNNGSALDLVTVLPLGLDESDFHEFGLKLEGSPHNGVHGALGDSNGLVMGIPNFAAQDPIFWLHHSNIDRLYACWETKNTVPKLVDDGNSYKFING
ncbi:tyrosinase family protein, partial [Vibrio parahaemolyticus]